MITEGQDLPKYRLSKDGFHTKSTSEHESWDAYLLIEFYSLQYMTLQYWQISQFQTIFARLTKLDNFDQFSQGWQNFENVLVPS